MPPTVPTRPASAANIDDVWGQWVHDWFKKRDLVRGSGNLNPTAAYQDIPGMTMTLGSGWFLIMALMDLTVGTAGVGQIDVVLDVDGVDQTGTARWDPSSTGGGTFGQAWLVNIAGAGVVKLQGKKSISAGAATIVGVNSALIVL